MIFQAIKTLHTMTYSFYQLIQLCVIINCPEFYHPYNPGKLLHPKISLGGKKKSTHLFTNIMCLSFSQSPHLVSLLQNSYHEAPCRLPTCDLIFTFSFPLAKASGCFYRYTGLPYSLSLQLSQHFRPWSCLQMAWFFLSSSWQLTRFITFLLNAINSVSKLPLESILKSLLMRLESQIIILYFPRNIIDTHSLNELLFPHWPAHLQGHTFLLQTARASPSPAIMESDAKREFNRINISWVTWALSISERTPIFHMGLRFPQSHCHVPTSLSMLLIMTLIISCPRGNPASVSVLLKIQPWDVLRNVSHSLVLLVRCRTIFHGR